MALVLVSAPALEPVTVDEAKAHLRIDGTVEDILITSLILTSRLHVESALGLALVDQGWRMVLDRWPSGGVVRMPLRPMKAVSEVRVLDASGVAAVVDADRYVVDVIGEPPRLVSSGAGWPVPGQVANGIEIDFTAGYGVAASDVPAPIRHAVMLLVAHWYEHRDPLEIGSVNAAVPESVSRLLKPYRMARL